MLYIYILVLVRRLPIKDISTGAWFSFTKRLATLDLHLLNLYCVHFSIQCLTSMDLHSFQFIVQFSVHSLHRVAKNKTYIVPYPVHWTAQSILHFIPWQTCSFQHQLEFSGKHSTNATITCKDYSLTFPPLSI